MSIAVRWLKNLISLQEKRPYSFLVIVCFTLFVTTVRMLEESFLGHRAVDSMLARMLQHGSFYLMCFLSYTVALRVVVPQPWRKTIQVVLVGIFCGIFPPIIDFLVHGQSGFRYNYAYLSTWKPLIYDPERLITFGEAAVLWLTIGLLGTYVAIRTGQLWRALVSLVVGYAVVLFNISVVFTLATFVYRHGSPKALVPADMTAAQLVATLILYLILNPKLALGLARRLNHALPFGLAFLVGAAFAGAPPSLPILALSLLPLFGFVVAIVQNDLYDASDDAFQGRKPYLDGHDVAFFNVLFLWFALSFCQVESFLGPLLIMFFVVSVVYNHPDYKGKRFFPANLKIEGVWGASACAMGIVAAMEREIGLSPVAPHLAKVEPAILADTFDGPTLALVALAFGGWSLLASLKEYKDIRADRWAGIQTPYTLGFKWGWNLHHIHRGLVATCALAVAISGPLLVVAGRTGLPWAGGTLVAGALIGWVMSSGPSGRLFEVVLGLLNATLLWLALAMWAGAP